jgi:hypothetical protein
MTWCWISLPHATFGIAGTGGKVIIAAPIAQWCVGCDWYGALEYYQRRGAKIVWVPLHGPVYRG